MRAGLGIPGRLGQLLPIFGVVAVMVRVVDGPLPAEVLERMADPVVGVALLWGASGRRVSW